MQVVVDSLPTEYQQAGKGKTVLVLHGWSDNSKGWRHTAAQFAEKFEVITLDLPGFGATPAPETVWGLDEYAAFVGKFLKKIRAKTFAIIGHASGGAIATRGLANGILQTERLVLINSAGIRCEYMLRPKMPILAMTIKTGTFITKPLPRNFKKQLRQKLRQRLGSNTLVLHQQQAAFKKIVTDDVQKDAAKLRLPTLLIYGEEDLDTPPQHGRMLHNLIAGSYLEVVAAAGHFAHLDRPYVVLPLVEGFLQ